MNKTDQMHSVTFSKSIFLFLLSLYFLSLQIIAQETTESKAELEALIKQAENSSTTLNKVNNIYSLLTFYRRVSNWQKADSLLKLGLSIAEKDDDKLAVVYAHMNYFTTGSYSILPIDKKQEMIEHMETALKLAQKGNFKNEETLILSRLGNKYAFYDLNFEKALIYFNQVDLNHEKVSDSARSDFYYWKSALYSRKQENLEMFRLILQAQKYAEKSKSSNYKARAYRVLGVYYKTLNDYRKAMEWHEKERLLVEEGKNKKSINNVNFVIARCYRDWGKYDEAIEKYKTVITYGLAIDDRFNSSMAMTELFDLYLKLGKRYEADSLDKRFQLLEKRKAANGPASYHFNKGFYYSLFNDDSMRFHYKKAVAYADSLKDSPAELEMKNYVYTNLIAFFRKEGEFQTAIITGQKAISVIKKLGLIANYPSVYEDLDSAYQSIGDYKNAYEARRQYTIYQDSAEALNDKTEALRLETIAEEENIANAENEKKMATERKHAIQYRFIVLGAILLLVGLLAIGFLHPPNWLVRGLAFVSFIFIFEFIILILDSKLHHWFHGAPLPILGIKILIACLLVPLHHIVEKRVIHFLQSKKLHRLKTVFKDDPVKN